MSEKTHLQNLQDQHSAARSQVKYWQEKEAKLKGEIYTLYHKERGIEAGLIVKDGEGKLAQVSRLNEYWAFGRFLRKNGEPGTKERALYLSPITVVAKSLEEWRRASGPAQEGRG